MTLFSVISLLTPTAYADGGATRNGDALVYQGNKYDKAAPADLPGDVVSKAPNTTGYRYVDNAGKAYFILTTGDPTKATTGYYEVYDYTPPNTYSNPTSSIQITIGTDNSQGIIRL